MAAQWLFRLVPAVLIAVPPVLAHSYAITELTPDLVPVLDAHARGPNGKSGHSAYDNGKNAYLVRNGKVKNIGHPDEFQGVFGIDGQDRVYALGAYDTDPDQDVPGNGIWYWDSGKWTLFTNADAFDAAAVNKSGLIVASAGGVNGPPVLLWHAPPGYDGPRFGDDAAYLSLQPENCGFPCKTVLNPAAGKGLDINNNGDVLFWMLAPSRSPEVRPFLYTEGRVRELSSFANPSDGWNLDEPTELALLEDGYVVGTAARNGVLTKFVLAPVPEPSSVILSVTTLAGVGLFVRRRRAIRKS